MDMFREYDSDGSGKIRCQWAPESQPWPSAQSPNPFFSLVEITRTGP